ncbi:oligogalacturonate lyase family protein [Celerinatantimonas sp. MCCC 1A17872]|uniref:oligogalacturonate lyase family protein n=1 Tax=Celerinatantimonas sp. MCCC 1A17872 TaxID=3177514 RepID=UPI0038C99E2F
MPKGNKVTLKFEEVSDDETGIHYTRLTPKDVICHRNYFYQKCFSKDGSKLLFAGDFDGGNRNYYLMDLSSQSAVQLTEGKGDNTFGGFLSHDEKSLYYVKNESDLLEVNLATLEERLVYRVPSDWVGYGTWVANSDCTQLVGIEIARSCWTPLTDWKIFRDFYFTNPTCRLINVDIRTGECEELLNEQRWLGHPIYRPFDNDTIAFCHEGPHDLVERMWLINRTDGKPARRVHEQAKGESCTHEFWIPDGSALAYVSYFKGQTARHIYKADPVTLENELVMQMPQLSHLMSNYDGSLMVGDGCDAPVDVSDSKNYEIENDPFLYVLNCKNKSAHRLVKHSSSWKVLDGDRQITHPHPSFSPDSSKVLYTTDAEGLPAIYLADVPEAMK